MRVGGAGQDLQALGAGHVAAVMREGTIFADPSGFFQMAPGRPAHVDRFDTLDTIFERR